MITIETLEVRKNGSTVCRVPSLQVAAGERVAVVGANGSGKTTLLTVLAGLNGPFSGRCEVAVPVAQRIYVHQQPYLFRGTVLFNAIYGLRARGVAKSDAHRRAQHWLAVLGIGGYGSRRVDNLSGGERRRVALARALAVEPLLLLLDEPLADLDASGVSAVREVLAGLTGMTVVVASPNPVPDSLVTRTIALA